MSKTIVSKSNKRDKLTGKPLQQVVTVVTTGKKRKNGKPAHISKTEHVKQ